MAALIDPFAWRKGRRRAAQARSSAGACAGTWPVLGVAFAVSALAGTLEVIAALLLGAVVDSAGRRRRRLLDRAWPLLLGFAAFYLVLPADGLRRIGGFQRHRGAAKRLPAVQSRLHRWTLGQAVTSSTTTSPAASRKSRCRPARALTDVTNEVINVVASRWPR